MLGFKGSGCQTGGDQEQGQLLHDQPAPFELPGRVLILLLLLLPLQDDGGAEPAVHGHRGVLVEDQALGDGRHGSEVPAGEEALGGDPGEQLQEALGGDQLDRVGAEVQ